MISEYDAACQTANQIDDADMLMNNLNTEDIERVVEELGLDAVPAHKLDHLQSFLEASNHTVRPSEYRSITRPSAHRRQLHSTYVMDENEESKSEYELNKFDPILFEKNGEVKSEYVGWTAEKNTEKLVTAGNEVSLEGLKGVRDQRSTGGLRNHSTVTALVAGTHHSADNISQFSAEGGVLDPYLQVNRERLFNLLLAYQSQTASQWNENVTGLGR